MAQPSADRIEINTCPQQMRRRGVAKRVWADAFGEQGGHLLAGVGNTRSDKRMGAEAGQRFTAAIQEDPLFR